MTMTLTARTLSELAPDERAAFFDRDAGVADARADARTILSRVQDEGDVALRELAREHDDVEVGTINVTDTAERAYDEIDEAVRTSLETAAANIRTFHEEQIPDDWRSTYEEDHRELGRRFRPLDRVGVYAPGGTAAYPSSVLMGVIPAVVAGVEHVALATPPGDPVHPVTRAAAHIAGADRIYAVGGAQAVGALAYGTESIDAVQKIVGPGNRWVTAAKAEVRGDVDIDFLAGPSEVLVIADETATPEYVAADLLAQAEHDPNASVVAVTDHEDTAEAIIKAVEAQISDRQRLDVITEALEQAASGVIVTRSMSEAILFAEEYAAEHLSIQAADDEAILDRIKNAGSVFLGSHTPVAAGDYASGTNHVLPTSGGARQYGGLSVDTFLRSTTVQRIDKTGLDRLNKTIQTLATAEGLEAHAESVRIRTETARAESESTPERTTDTDMDGGGMSESSVTATESNK
ncbi:MAG: histidinol dehydrogenase [Haloquadratum walsbyi J07HQW2]|uniref:Histidinol dehydrogenase n=2 Tax=Haloquadratum walsbyi TaxID=293091 RepID=U1NDW5_9EURY|nr:MAG: histidinol dehydrogenase [Haloquadratum walsbyi J07HQW2]